MTNANQTALEGFDTSNLAYIRSIQEAELSALPNEALSEVQDFDALYVITNGDGKKLAIVEGRAAAMAAALANALQPVSVH